MTIAGESSANAEHHWPKPPNEFSECGFVVCCYELAEQLAVCSSFPA
jgi:hypothetical protein